MLIWFMMQVVVYMYRSPKWRVMVRRDFPKPVVKRVAYGLNTVNLGRIYAAIFDSVERYGVRAVRLIDENNVVCEGSLKQGIRRYGYDFPAIWYIAGGSGVADSLSVIARLGTGSSSPSRNDYRLQSPVAGDIQLTSNYNDGNVVTLTGTGGYASAFSPSEVGVFIEGGGGPTDVKRVYMIDRTVFTPLPTGNVFTVRVDIPLG
jgi:hypothetical protein